MARRSTKPYVYFADIYDQIMADVPYEDWMDYVAGVWLIHSFSPSSVLDLACGTGNMTVRLAKRGLHVIGVDSSERMLSVARRKLAAEGLYAGLVHADMRSFRLDEQVDAAISLFDSINYLVEPDEVKSAFQCVNEAIRPGGLFIFDVNTPERLASIRKEVHLFEGSDHFLIWSDHYDSSHKSWRVRLTGFLKAPAIGGEDGDGEHEDSNRPKEESGDRNGGWTRFDEVHRERAFPIADLTTWLEEAGFRTLNVYDSLSFRPVAKYTSRAYFVAQKR